MLDPSLISPENAEFANAALAKESLRYWCKLTRDEWICEDAHLKIIEALEAVERGELTRLMIECPPRFGKSTLTDIDFATWYMGKHPEHEVMLATYGQDLSDDLSRMARNKFDEFGPRVFNLGVSRDSKAVDRWHVADHKGAYRAVSLTSSITGRGGKLLIADDLTKNAQDADSETETQKKIKFWRETFRTRLAPDGGAIIVIGTRWRDNDIMGWLQAEGRAGTGEPWTVISMPMISESGALLSPKRFPREEIDRIRLAIGDRAFRALYLQDPVPDKGSIFRREWFRYYTSLPPRWDMTAIGVDCATKEDGTDWTVFQYWGVFRGDYYLLNQRRGHWDYPDIRRNLQDFTNLCKPDVTAVELAATGEPVVKDLRGLIPGLVGEKVSTVKDAKQIRAKSISPMWEAGQVYLPQGKDWVLDFEKELLHFPNGSNDDQIDAMCYALKRLKQTSYTASFTALPSRYQGAM